MADLETSAPALQASFYSDENLDSDQKPSHWAKWVSARPATMLCASTAPFCCFFFIWAILLFSGAYELSLDVILEDRDNYLWRRDAALEVAKEDLTTQGETFLQQTYNSQEDVLSIIFEKKGDTDTVFTFANIEHMRVVEQHVLNDPEYADFCLMDGEGACETPLSVLNFFYPEARNCTVENCTALGPWIYNGKGTEMQDIDTTLQLMAANPSLSDLFVDRDFNANNLKSDITQVIFVQGLPLAGYSSPIADQDEQWLKIDEWQASFLDFLLDQDTDILRVLWWGRGIYTAHGQLVLYSDMFLAVGSMLVVFLIMLLMMRSFFLASMATMQTLLSFPVAMLMYKYLFQIHYFGVLQVLAIYITLGIGADDVFIFVDTWNLSEKDPSCGHDLLSRMNFAYKRSRSAMLVTSATTFFAFVITAVFPLVSVSTFGVFAACLVFVNYVLVITVFPAVVAVYHSYARFWCGCCSRNQADNDVFMVEIKHRDIEPRFDDSVADVSSSKSKSTVTTDNSENAAESVSFVHKFVVHHFSPVITHHRYKFFIFAALMAMMCVFFVFACFTEMDEQPPVFFPKGHKLRDVLDLQSEFKATNGQFTVQVEVVWGIDDVSSSENWDRFDLSKRGIVVYDDTFDLSDARAQDTVKKMCEDAFSYPDPDLQLRGTVDDVLCFIRDFDDWAESEPNVTHTSTNRSEGALFVSYLQQFMNTFPYSSRYVTEVGLFGDDVRFAVVRFETTTPWDNRGRRFDLKNAWEAYVETINEVAPETANKSWPISMSWVFNHVALLLFLSTWIAIAVGMAVAYIVLVLFTLNFIIAAMAIFTVGCVVVSVLGTIYLIGWKMGVLESVASIMVVGFAIDYTVHLAFSYVESPHTDRVLRVRDSINFVGISVLSGALTTMGASFLLFFTTIVYLLKYGVIIFCIIGFSLLYSMGLFTTMCAIIGPQNDTGNLKPFVRRTWESIRTKFL